MNTIEKSAAPLLEEIPRPVVEMTMDEVSDFADPTDLNGYVSKADDWTLSADEQRSAAERQQRAEDALLTSSGAMWWAALTPSGFGPVEPASLGTKSTTVYDGTEVIVTYDAVDTDELRSEAGLHKSTSWNVRYSVDGLYRDFVSAARVFTADSEDADLWSEDGYRWEVLANDSELAASLPSFDAYWE